MSFFKRLFANHKAKHMFAVNTVKSLSALDDHLLCDLGLSRVDLYEARRARRAANFLQQRAAERAASWIR